MSIKLRKPISNTPHRTLILIPLKSILIYYYCDVLLDKPAKRRQRKTPGLKLQNHDRQIADQVIKRLSVGLPEAFCGFSGVIMEIKIVSPNLTSELLVQTVFNLTDSKKRIGFFNSNLNPLNLSFFAKWDSTVSIFRTT
jgi:hypothetical protein